MADSTVCLPSLQDARAAAVEALDLLCEVLVGLPEDVTIDMRVWAGLETHIPLSRLLETLADDLDREYRYKEAIHAQPQ